MLCRIACVPRKPRRIRSALRAEIGEVEVGAGAIASCHAFAKAALGPEAGEDDEGDADCEDFDDDGDDGAD
jgi:hypothetical protein